MFLNFGFVQSINAKAYSLSLHTSITSTSVDTPRIPNIWSSKPFLIWQRTDDYSFDNYTLDADLYNGSLKELKAFINSSVLSN